VIDLTEVGAFPSLEATGQFSVRFGLYLQGIQSAAGFEVRVRVIHLIDRFDPAVPAATFTLEWQPGSALDLWSATVELVPVGGSQPATQPGSHLGQPGLHLYRYELWWTPVGSAAGTAAQCISSWIVDPFAREAEIGRMSAFLLDPTAQPFAWTDAAYKTPELDDLVVYELQVEEFNDTFDGVAAQLVYLKSLGVNCIELMPVTSMQLDFDWGYGPLHYFAPGWRWGGSAGLKRLVDAAHAQGIAVILDVVYEHVDPMFAYNAVYGALAGAAGSPNTAGLPNPPNPMMDGQNIYGFGPKPDFTLAFTLDYFQNANQQWLDDFHIDGFRYDEVTDLYVPPMDAGYRTLVEQTYLHSLTLPRFQGVDGGYSRIIQCAEALDKAATVMEQSYTNAAWQNGLLNLAEGVASGAAPQDSYALQLNPSIMGFPASTSAVDAQGNAIQMPVAPFQYLESHDHSQLICFTDPSYDTGDPIPEGDRSRWYSLQPHAIALYTLQGIPMLWQGQEFADNYNLPNTGLARIHLERDTHWEYFYDAFGQPLVSLYRRLGGLRSSTRALRGRDSYYYNQASLQGNQVLIYSRHSAATAAEAESWALVLLNFGDNDGTVQAPFPAAGTWREMLDDSFRAAPLEVSPGQAGQTIQLTVPSNYGQVWVKVG
jgi:1,4-alpha-glucan branching enzyme